MSGKFSVDGASAGLKVIGYVKKQRGRFRPLPPGGGGLNVTVSRYWLKGQLSTRLAFTALNKEMSWSSLFLPELKGQYVTTV